ncbi:aldehyde dehydrogenase family protein [Frankia sp. Cr1]|uniref:aldehyde dehydrogenase family protein n=1 Tax=Frankia sp. Cr1 TaxID=3073931 RepID=UPI002AD295A1|nr:aldehyde dehydrogenase family protein [Frankia sp. Cr1]
MSTQAPERTQQTPFLAEERWKGRIYLGEWVDAPATLDVTERAAVLRRAAGLIEQHHDELARWIIRETGGIVGKTAVELQASASELLEAAALPSQPNGHLLPSTVPGRTSLARRYSRSSTTAWRRARVRRPGGGQQPWSSRRGS